MIDPATVQRIKDAADIVEVVSDYVHLVRRGANYMGLCPFHNERTPSFSVNKGKNFCFCFSCKKGGSPVNFIMEKEGLTYHEALLHLAKKYNIEVQERDLTDEEKRRQSERESMLVANEWAMKLMESDLRNTEDGRDIGLQYFTQRGVTDEAMRAFHLGYAMDNGEHLTNEARKAGYDLNVLKKLGLIGTSSQGKDYDRFRGRVIFPIINSSGKVIAFGGRDLKGGLAKYINSPESDLYKKSNELYGIFQARSAIVKENKCFLVEGYMDVIGMWQSGLKNVVASSGTALTDGQIAMIHRFTENITLIYDGDAAGIKAALRGIDMLLSHRLKVSVLLLPDGEDPDSFARGRTPEEFRDFVARNETDVIRFKAKVLLDEVRNNPQKRIEAVNSVVQSIAHIPDPIARDVYIQECSTALGIPEATIAMSVSQSREAIKQRMQREREYRRFPVDDNKPSSPSEKPVVSHKEEKKIYLSPEKHQLYPIEMPVIRYCIRYGFIDFCRRTENDENSGNMTVVEFIADELHIDSMQFSIDVYNKLLKILLELLGKYREELSVEQTRIESELQALRNAEYERISRGGYSMLEIEREEKKIEKEISERREKMLVDFSKDYPGKVLASYEDDEIRNVVTDLLKERHQLSNIYVKNGANEPEEERLFTLIPRALMEWKAELLNLRLKDLLKEFHDIAGKGDAEKEHALQLELTRIMKMRTEVAKDIGERIVSGK